MPAASDIDLQHWSHRLTPPGWHPWLRLARLDRPVGIWLLLWPCWFGLALSGASLEQWLWMGPAFAAGAVLMRSAGCVVNDLLDRDLDAQVARTRTRPLAAGQITPRGALIFLALLLLPALAILLLFNPLTVALGVAVLGPVALYPLMKRVTWWPQAVLGLVFNWGALMAGTAVLGEVTGPILLLWLGGVAWTLGYDTIYALQDLEDDARIGIRSSARALGGHVRNGVALFYGATVLFWLGAAWLAGGHALGISLLALVLGKHFAWQVGKTSADDPVTALHLFKSNIKLGGAVLAALLLASEGHRLPFAS